MRFVYLPIRKFPLIEDLDNVLKGLTQTQFNIEGKRTTELPIWIAILAMFVALSIIWMSTGDVIIQVTTFIVLILLSFSLVHFFPYLNQVGSLTFDEDEIRIIKTETVTIKLDEIKAVELRFQRRRGLYHNSIDLGNRNTIEIQFNNDSIKYFLCINKKDEELSLRLALLNLYSKGIKVDEKIMNQRSYGLEILNFQEIQQFKERYSRS